MTHATDIPAAPVPDASAPDTLAGTSVKPAEDNSGAPSPDVSALFSDHQEQLVYHLKCRGADAPIAEDLVQETFIRAMDHLDSLRDPDKALAWLRKVADNLFNDAYRREGRHKFEQYEAVEQAFQRRGRKVSDDGDDGDDVEDPFLSMDDPTDPDDTGESEPSESEFPQGPDLRMEEEIRRDEYDESYTFEEVSPYDDDEDDFYDDDEDDEDDEDDGFYDDDEEDEEDSEETDGDGQQRRKRLPPEPDDAFMNGSERLQAGFWKYSPEWLRVVEARKARREGLELLVPTLLSSTQRRALLLRSTEELSYAEIGRRLGISPATARTHVKRAREYLRRIFEGSLQRPIPRPDLAWEDLALSRANAGDLAGAAQAHALAGWAACGYTRRFLFVLRDAAPEGDSAEARAVRYLLALGRRELPRAGEALRTTGKRHKPDRAWTDPQTPRAAAAWAFQRCRIFWRQIRGDPETAARLLERLAFLVEQASD